MVGRVTLCTKSTRIHFNTNKREAHLNRGEKPLRRGVLRPPGLARWSVGIPCRQQCRSRYRGPRWGQPMSRTLGRPGTRSQLLGSSARPARLVSDRLTVRIC